MTEHLKKEIISAVKWTWIICAAAGAFYLVSPKYFFRFDKSEVWRVNKITGEGNVSYGLDDKGNINYAWPIPS